ncbi:hypothetical protein AR1Y2_2097 [Anaerostipes rhamnosivorans]|uniref:Uncharacterized protein n=1 Tax=Anaerostipes rhamnosivorans TaxID=1229621 RepID=A0A4P8IF89_9FIRM|nr:hypothetical protein AR1Y2_2097 [Anaerostipes rhamnosivorans]
MFLVFYSIGMFCEPPYGIKKPCGHYAQKVLIKNRRRT